MNFDCGIYTITSPSGKQYVGSAVSFKRRWGRHLRNLRSGTHINRHLQNAFNKYGEKSLVFAKVAFVPKGDLLTREQEQIDARPRNKLYNKAVVAQAPMTGVRHTAESRARMSESQTGRKHTPEELSKMSKAMRGRKHSAEHRAKNSAANMGRIIKPEHRAKISAANKGRTVPEAERMKMFKAKNTSGYRGVSKDARSGKWLARVNLNGKREYAGLYGTPEEANEAILAFREKQTAS